MKPLLSWRNRPVSYIYTCLLSSGNFPDCSVVKESACNAEDPGSR